MAIIAEMVPFTMARTFMGREMKPLVAPTICMVLIRKRLLYIASLMVLSISTMLRMQKMPARMANTIRPTTNCGSHLLNNESRIFYAFHYQGLLFKIGLDIGNGIFLNILSF